MENTSHVLSNNSSLPQHKRQSDNVVWKTRKSSDNEVDDQAAVDSVETTINPSDGWIYNSKQASNGQNMSVVWEE